jgi:hypothetical protein
MGSLMKMSCNPIFLNGVPAPPLSISSITATRTGGEARRCGNESVRRENRARPRGERELNRNGPEDDDEKRAGARTAQSLHGFGNRNDHPPRGRSITAGDVLARKHVGKGQKGSGSKQANPQSANLPEKNLT